MGKIFCIIYSHKMQTSGNNENLVYVVIVTLPVESSIMPLAVVMEPNIMEGLVVSSIRFILKNSCCSISPSRVSGMSTVAVLLDGLNVAV